MRLLLPAFLAACTPAAPPAGPPPADPPPAAPPAGPGPALVLALADFEVPPGGPVTLQPARALVLRPGADGALVSQALVDPASVAFHQAIVVDGAVWTIGADKARLVRWAPGPPATPTVIWEASFGGRNDRLRDLAVGPAGADGHRLIALATHDQGIVAVGSDAPGAAWTELGRRPRTFVHEVELGDLDGDGALEIYATPSEPNRASGASQPGGVERWVRDGDTWRREPIIAWETTHAKEILVADLGDGPGLYAAREGVVGPAGELVAPATIVRLRPDGAAWREKTVAPLRGERQARFLVAGDVDGDGRTELVATGSETGVWRLDPGPDGFVATVVDPTSGGFEQAAHLADLDGDGRLELYVASERRGEPRELRRYRWRDGAARRETLLRLDGDGIVWGIASGVF